MTTHSPERWVPAAGLSVASLVIACSPAPLAPRVEVTPTVTAVLSGDSYVYILHGGDRVALIDAGSDASGTAILDALARIGRSADEVEAILITHGHRDHWAAAAQFPAATVYAADAAHRMIRGDRRIEGFGPRLAAHLGSAPPIPRRLRSVLPRTVLDVAGHEVDVIPLPGHTAGSVAFLVDDVLFTGDSLQLSAGGLDAAPASTSGDRDANLRVLRRLADLRFQTIADSHHGIARDGGERLARWLAEQP